MHFLCHFAHQKWVYFRGWLLQMQLSLRAKSRKSFSKPDDTEADISTHHGSATFTFFTSARRSFFRTGLSLTSEVACCDLDSADSHSDSERLSDSDELLDSELCDRLFSLPCSLSDWLPDSDAERLDSSEAELLQEQEHVHSFDLAGACGFAYILLCNVTKMQGELKQLRVKIILAPGQGEPARVWLHD